MKLPTLIFGNFSPEEKEQIDTLFELINHKDITVDEIDRHLDSIKPERINSILCYNTKDSGPFYFRNFIHYSICNYLNPEIIKTLLTRLPSASRLEIYLDSGVSSNNLFETAILLTKEITPSLLDGLSTKDRLTLLKSSHTFSTVVQKAPNLMPLFLKGILSDDKFDLLSTQQNLNVSLNDHLDQLPELFSGISSDSQLWLLKKNDLILSIIKHQAQLLPSLLKDFAGVQVLSLLKAPQALTYLVEYAPDLIPPLLSKLKENQHYNLLQSNHALSYAISKKANTIPDFLKPLSGTLAYLLINNEFSLTYALKNNPDALTHLLPFLSDNDRLNLMFKNDILKTAIELSSDSVPVLLKDLSSSQCFQLNDHFFKRHQHTAISHAIKINTPETISALLDPLNPKDKKTLLKQHDLLYASEHNSFTAVQILLDAGASVFQYNQEGKDALELARDDNIIKLLVDAEEKQYARYKADVLSALWIALVVLTLGLAWVVKKIVDYCRPSAEDSAAAPGLASISKHPSTEALNKDHPNPVIAQFQSTQTPKQDRFSETQNTLGTTPTVEASKESNPYSITI